MIQQIVINEHSDVISQKTFYVEQVKLIILDELQNAELDQVSVYQTNGKQNTLLGGTKKRLVVLANCPTVHPNSILIEVDGNAIASFYYEDDAGHHLNIFENLFAEYSEQNLNKFHAIFREVDKFYRSQLNYYSWKHTNHKEELASEFQVTVRDAHLRTIEDDREKIQQYEDKIRSFSLDIRNMNANRIRLMNQIESAELKAEQVSTKLLNELDNIVNHPKVKDLIIRNGKFIIETEPIYAYHDKIDARYYIGNMRIELQPENTRVRFFGDNPRRSYWTERDPHPHVNGRNGEACLGNIAPTIAELCSQMELYALVMICIDFLESVNTDDPAGRNINRWDKVDDQGNIIDPARDYDEEDDDRWVCDSCEEYFSDDDESWQVYQSYVGNATGDGEWGSEYTVCTGCREEYYTYHDDIEAIVYDGHCVIRPDEDETVQEETA